MMRDGWRMLDVLVLAVMVSSCGASLPAAAPEDTAAIRALILSQAEAWNRHDAKAYADLFTANCDVVNVVGQWWNGRAELEREVGAAHATMFKDSALTFTDVQIRFLTPQLAIAHMRWTMTGAMPPPRFPAMKQGIQTLVVHKQVGQWLIDAFQNTNSMPESVPASALSTARSRPNPWITSRSPQEKST